MCCSAAVAISSKCFREIRFRRSKRLFRSLQFSTHPGNILFSLKALELIPQYEEPNKMTTRDQLIDYVSSIGGRFLTQDEEEKHSWFEADHESVKVKASQTLRDKKKDFSEPKKRDAKRRDLVSKLR